MAWPGSGSTVRHSINYPSAATTSEAGQGTSTGTGYGLDYVGGNCSIQDVGGTNLLCIDLPAGGSVAGFTTPAADTENGQRLFARFRFSDFSVGTGKPQFHFMFGADETDTPWFQGDSYEIRMDYRLNGGFGTHYFPLLYRDSVFLDDIDDLGDWDPPADLDDDMEIEVSRWANTPSKFDWFVRNLTLGTLLASGTMEDTDNQRSQAAGRAGFFVSQGSGGDYEAGEVVRLRGFEYETNPLVDPLAADDPGIVSQSASGATMSVPAPSGGVGPYTVAVYRCQTPSSDLEDYTLVQGPTAIAEATTWTDNTVGANVWYMMLLYEDSEGRTLESKPVAYTARMATPTLPSNRRTGNQVNVRITRTGDSITFLADETELEGMIEQYQDTAGGYSTVVDDHAVNGSSTGGWDEETDANVIAAIASANANQSTILIHGININDANISVDTSQADFINRHLAYIGIMKDNVPTLEHVLLVPGIYAKAGPWSGSPDFGLVITHQSLDRVVNRYNPALATIAASANALGGATTHVHPVDLYRLFAQDPDTLLSEDLLHPSTAGFTLLHTAHARWVVELLFDLVDSRRRGRRLVPFLI